MKLNLLKYPILALFVATIFTSCDKDDNDSNKIIVKIGAQSNTTVGAFYSVGQDKVYTQALAYENQDTIDMLCFYEESTGNYTTISSPGAGISDIFTGETAPDYWTTTKTTKFTDPATDITTDQFDQLENGDATIASYFDETVTNGYRKKKNLAVNDIYAFMTEDSIYGLFKVTEVVAGVDGYLEMELKVKNPSK